MGIIIRQSLKSSFWSYFGILIGFITTSILYPKYLTTDIVGLFGLLLAYSSLFADFSSLGFQGITGRLFPYFRNKGKKHNGYLFILLSVTIVGFMIFIVVFLILKPLLVESNIEKSKIFVNYINLLIPLTFFTLLFFQLDMLNKMLYNTVFGTFLQEFLQRILILTFTLLYALHVINLHLLILAFAASICIKGLFMLISLFLKRELNFKPQLLFLNKKLKKEIFRVGIFSILTGFGGSIVFSIDKILINQMLGLSPTGVYTIAFFFGTLVIIPSRSLNRISGTLIADAFKKNDLKYIANIYQRSCINQLILGAFVFGGIWINIGNILIILGPDYNDAKWVIFFIGLSYLVDMSTGTNGQIIAYSKHYRISFLFILLLIVFVISTMLFLVPLLGIVGGSIAMALSIIMNNFMKTLFLKIKYKLQPFNWQFIQVVIIFLIGYLLSMILPHQKLIPDILIRSSIFAVVYAFLIIKLNISKDITQISTYLFKFLGVK